MSEDKHNWQLRLDDYLNHRPLERFDDARLNEVGLAELSRRTDAYLRGEYDDYHHIAQFAGDDDLILIMEKSWFSVCSVSARKVVATMTPSFPFTDPEFRRRGLVSEVFKLQDEQGHRRWSSCYTLGGLMNRVRTHRLHLQGALDRGDAIPAEVMKDYRVEGGRVSLRVPFDPEAYDAPIRARAEEEKRLYIAAYKREFEDKVSHLKIVFQRFNEDKGRPDGLYVYDHTRLGERLALAVKVRHGGQIRVTHVDDLVDTVVRQVQIGDLVIDAFGIRALDDAQHDLCRRLNINAGDIKSVKTCASITDYAQHAKTLPSDPQGEDPEGLSVEVMLERVSMGLATLRSEIEAVPDMEMTI